MKLHRELSHKLLWYISLLYLNSTEIADRSERTYLDHVFGYVNDPFEASWCEGGTQGSCYLDEPVEVEASEEPIMDSLMDLLQECFRDLSDDAIYDLHEELRPSGEYDSYSESDCYGGIMEYGRRQISFETVATRLQQLFHADAPDSDLVDFFQALHEHAPLMARIGVRHMTWDNIASLELFQQLDEELACSAKRPAKKI